MKMYMLCSAFRVSLRVTFNAWPVLVMLGPAWRGITFVCIIARLAPCAKTPESSPSCLVVWKRCIVEAVINKPGDDTKLPSDKLESWPFCYCLNHITESLFVCRSSFTLAYVIEVTWRRKTPRKRTCEHPRRLDTAACIPTDEES